MSRRCALTGKGPLSGNNVSHAHNKTRRVQRPNVQEKRLYVPELGRMVRLKLSTRALRTVNKKVSDAIPQGRGPDPQGRGASAERPATGEWLMKPDIHPEYRPVVFKDAASDFQFLTRSTVKSRETVTWEDGNEYPLVTLEISSASHPFFTGKQKLVDTAGRIERFRRRYGLPDES